MYKVCGTSEETKNETNDILVDETEEILFEEIIDKQDAIKHFDDLVTKMEKNELFASENNPIIYICLKEDGKIIKEKSVYKIKKSGKSI